MEEKITLCGDNCMECPRYNAHSAEELEAVAELWYRVGWRNHVVSKEEISCTGCSSHKQCTYQLVECTKEHNVHDLLIFNNSIEQEYQNLYIAGALTSQELETIRLQGLK